jgi:hypothetical protein
MRVSRITWSRTAGLSPSSAPSRMRFIGHFRPLCERA